MVDMHQIYIDPIYIKGNILRVFLLWDWKTKIELKIEFVERKIISGDRFKIIRFITELMRRSDLDFVMTKEQFINIQFKEFPGLAIEVVKIDF